MPRVNLTRQQIYRLIDSLSAHFAGDTSEGDLSWTKKEHETAARAMTILRLSLLPKEPK